MKFEYINESSLGKILALGGGLAGTAIAGENFMDTVHQGEHINPLINPDASVDNTLDSLGNFFKIPVYGLGGAAAGGLAGAGLNALINSKSSTQPKSKIKNVNYRTKPW